MLEASCQWYQRLIEHEEAFASLCPDDMLGNSVESVAYIVQASYYLNDLEEFGGLLHTRLYATRVESRVLCIGL